MRRTWSPRGHTPVLRHRLGWKKASMAAALGYHADGTKARLCFHLHQPSYNTDALIGVLDQLGAFSAGHQVVLIWDGLLAHWSTRMRAFIDSQHGWLTVERLPAYAPDLNPVEGLWANRKDVELANLPGASLVEVADQAQRGIQRVCASDELVAGFLATAASPSTMSRQPNPRNSNKGLGSWGDVVWACNCGTCHTLGRRLHLG